MMRVTIDINGKIIHQTNVVRQSKLVDKDMVYEYKQDTGNIIKHKYSDGAIDLSIAMLNILKEIKY